MFKWNLFWYLNEINKQFYKTPLHIAVEEGNSDILKLLLDEKGLDVNIQDHIQKIIWIKFLILAFMIIFQFHGENR